MKEIIQRMNTHKKLILRASLTKFTSLITNRNTFLNYSILMTRQKKDKREKKGKERDNAKIRHVIVRLIIKNKDLHYF